MADDGIFWVWSDDFEGFRPWLVALRTFVCV